MLPIVSGTSWTAPQPRSALFVVSAALLLLLLCQHNCCSWMNCNGDCNNNNNTHCSSSLLYLSLSLFLLQSNDCLWMNAHMVAASVRVPCSRSRSCSHSYSSSFPCIPGGDCGPSGPCRELVLIQHTLCDVRRVNYRWRLWPQRRRSSWNEVTARVAMTTTTTSLL